MSQPLRPAPAKQGGGGSVRRARERMEAEREAGMARQPPVSLPSGPKPKEKANSSAPRVRPQMPLAFAGTKGGQGPIGVAISKPTQVPQWPLSGTIENVYDVRNNGNQQYQPPSGRGVAPQRPPRPSRVPSMLDSSRVQDPTPSFTSRAQPNTTQERQRDPNPIDNLLSPTPSEAFVPSSRPSTMSSVGSIPDFPLPDPSAMPPVPPMPAPTNSNNRKSLTLGPPPTARRGASSYYSQQSFVSPIPEESSRVTSHVSYASSAAIPTSWGTASPDFADDDFLDRDMGIIDDTIEEGRESRESYNDENEQRGLIRSASVGKRAGKPSMVTTKAPETVRPSAAPQQVPKLWDAGSIENGRPGPRDATPSRSYLDKSTSSSEETVPQIARVFGATPAMMRKHSGDLLNNQASASSLRAGNGGLDEDPESGFKNGSAMRRPPRLNMDAVRDAEARGSLTSLPDLIRRATRLAAMMDRGKRPGSRLNDLTEITEAHFVGRDKDVEMDYDEKRQSGFSGMLKQFPPPGRVVPSRNQTPESWPRPDLSDGPEPRGVRAKRTKKERKGCCGLSCYCFCLVILVGLLIVAAAVVVPLELLVFNKHKSTAPVSALEQCAQNNATACQNGGTATLSTSRCSCICINGFTGPTCAIAGSAGCTTADFPDASNVTLGEAIPRLITSAQSNFSLPLNSTIILARFNSANLSCTSENALVTFDGESERQGSSDSVVVPSASITTSLDKRQISSPTTSSVSVATTNGILYDPDLSYALPTPSTTLTPLVSSSAATSALATPTQSPSDNFAVTEEVLDFARVSVLYILQEEDLGNAEEAQITLQHFFALDSFTNQAAQNVSLGNGNSADLLNLSLELAGSPIVPTGSGNSTVARRSSRIRLLDS